MELMQNPQLRAKLGEGGRKRAVECYDYRVVARKFIQLVEDRLGVS
jgi:glycosyltransferase involved in cell wall biosynthesis